MKKMMFACLLSIPVTAFAVIANTTDDIQSRNEQLAGLVKQSFYSDVSRLHLTPEQYTVVVTKIRHNQDDLAADIKKVLNEDQKETFDTIMAEKKSAMGDNVGF